MRKALLPILIGASSSLALGRLDAFSATGALATTLSILPLSAGLFAAAHAVARPQDGLFDIFGAAKPACVAVLTLLALGHASLGLRYGDVLVASVVFAGICCLLFWQALESLNQLQRISGRSCQIAFFLAVLAVFAATILCFAAEGSVKCMSMPRMQVLGTGV